MDEILEARAYIQAKGLVESATTSEARKALPSSDLIALAQQIEFEITRQSIKETKSKSR